MPLKDVQVYALLGNDTGSLWGCLVALKDNYFIDDIGRNEYCQIINNHLYIPERSIIYPAVSEAEMGKLFLSGKHIVHPEFGVAALGEKINWKKLISVAEPRPEHVIQPEYPTFIPARVRSFQIKPTSPEESIKDLEENVFPKNERLKTNPLNIFEKAKLILYKGLLGATGTGTKGNNSSSRASEPPVWFKFLDRFMPTENSKWIKKIREDYENLEERNKKQIDKLMDLLKKDPMEALKYAIPINIDGTTRGGNSGAYELSKRWSNLSLFGHNLSAGSGTISVGDYGDALQAQYLKTAQQLIDRKEYHSAAFIYMRLLKNPFMAAQTLEAGGLYQEAAAIYLKHGNNKIKAAECYEKGNMIAEAIAIYKELKENEKVGDLYMKIYQKDKATDYYNQVIEAYCTNYQYLKASLIYKNKLGNAAGGQSLLLKGWRTDKDALKCLSSYFANIPDPAVLRNELTDIYANDVGSQNELLFLQVIKKHINTQKDLTEDVRNMAYEIIARQLPKNPSVVIELREFNIKDKEFTKDTMRFRNSKK